VQTIVQGLCIWHKTDDNELHNFKTFFDMITFSEHKEIIIFDSVL